MNSRMFDDEPDLPWIGQFVLGGQDGRHPIECYNFRQWAEWMETSERVVAISGNAEIRVSTVFLGLDHRHFGDGPPILFETMVFGGKFDHECERYCSWKAAEAGHKRWTIKVFPAISQKASSPGKSVRTKNGSIGAEKT